MISWKIGVIVLPICYIFTIKGLGFSPVVEGGREERRKKKKGGK